MKLLITGDFCPQDRVARKIENGENDVFSAPVLEQITRADYAVTNFECAVADASVPGIPKCGPHLHCSEKAVRYLKETGFDCVTLANNHFRDYGDEGVKRTLAALKEQGIDYVGGGENIEEACKTLYKTVDGRGFAIINVCENEFSIASENRGGSAPIDVIDVCHRIKEAKERGTQTVIVIVHGGHEHWQYPSPRMKKWYRFFVESGADAVVNHHQHCYSGYEVYQGKPIFYGLGNFCFDHPKKRGGIWNEGYMVMLDITEAGISHELIPYRQCDETPSVELMTGPEKQTFDQMVKTISNTIADDRLLEEKWNDYVKKRSRTVVTPFTPYLSGYARAAAGRHWLPYMMPEKKVADMLNFIQCEAHRDLLSWAMQKKLE